MIIYMYLAIIIVFSILTGIITTIIEKKGLSTEAHNSVVQNINIPNKVIREKKVRAGVSIPIVRPDSDLSNTIEVLNISDDLGIQSNTDSVNDDYSEPVLVSIVDDEII